MTLLTAAPVVEPSTISPPDRGSPAALIERARAAQQSWAARPIRRRLDVIRAARRLMVERAERLATTVTHGHRRNEAETLASEVMPLVEAARYLERRAGRVLRPRAARSGRPMIGRDLVVRVSREPWGVVLIIGPGNYPLMLPGVQAFQALAAGNAVVLKPGRAGELAAEALRGTLVDAGLPGELFVVLASDAEAGLSAIEAGVDHVVLTGSEAAGRAVGEAAGRALTPMTAELGGHDAMLVLDDADLDLVVRALVFGLTSNRGGTCIAPRRLFATPGVARQIEQRLVNTLPTGDPAPLRPDQADRIDDAIADARHRGARLLVPSPVHGEGRGEHRTPDHAAQTVADAPHDARAAGRPESHAPTMPPTVLTDVPPDARIMHDDLFAPLLAICPIDSIDRAVEHVNGCRYGLGASVFGSPANAESIAARLDVGCVTVNDLIAPVGDPRLPLAGRGISGFGVTRGDEGLRAMTRPRALANRRGRFRPHYDPPTPATAAMIRGYLDFAHGRSLRQRLAGLRKLIRSIRGES